jgi:septal ring factor EnvC (AmiA/AmiB activator)
MRAVLFVAFSAITACAEHQRATSRANPVRKVVGLLQKMQVQVEAEGEKEKELFDKFMCYCKTGAGDLEKSIEAAEAKIPQLEADIKSAKDKKAQVDDTLEQAKKDRVEAKEAMAAATAQREKEATEFAKFQTDSIANIQAIMKAVAALEKGASGGFLQTSAAGTVRQILASGKLDIPDADRDEVEAFLQGNPFSQGYAAQSGEITGILKQMGDEMATALAKATAVEQKSIFVYKELMAAKAKEVGALTKQIEDKISLSGELAVSIAEMENDLGDSAEMLAQDKKFLAELKKSCSTKEAEWEERCKIRKAEIAALADTIKILNADDALELFKKTLPGSASLLELAVSSKSMRTRALSLLKKAKVDRSHHVMLSFITAALSGKKIGFEKIITMIDEMVATLKQEQKDDDSKKEYCNEELDTADDKKKSLEKTISDTEAAIEATKEGIAETTTEIEELIAGIKALDKSVAEATETRKAENSEYKELMANDSAAKELLKLAQNRLNKFYNPKMYVAPAKAERSKMDAIAEDVGGAAALVQVHMHGSAEAAPPPPPETFGAYVKRSEEHTGVVQMLNLLITDLDKEMAEAETTEKDSQADYEELMQESAAKRAEDSKSLADKEKAKADMEADLQAHTEKLGSAKKDLAATLKYIHGLHLECDWLLKYYDVRAEMRAGEVDALGKAKAVLNGADYSLLQTGSRHH